MRRLVIRSIVCLAAVVSLGVEGAGPPLPGGFAPATDSHLGGVLGGPHDFSRFGGNACQACHVPHIQVIRPATAATTSGPATQPAVEMFELPGQVPVFEPGRFSPGPTSLVCLGCHDGTIGRSTIGSAHSFLAGVRPGFGGTDNFPWRDHPIGLPYKGNARSYRPLEFVQKQGIRLPNGRVECISCHDPHNRAGVDHLLRMSNSRSAMCLTCHLK